MPINFIKPLFALFLSTIALNTWAQDNDFDQLSKTPKDTSIRFPLDYKIARPRIVFPNWDKDYDVYYDFLTPALRKTQVSMRYANNGVTTVVVPNSIMPHAQLDTTTIVNDAGKLVGTWRMINFRSIRFNDSVNLPTKTYYRLDDMLLDDKSNDEAFATISDGGFKLYVKEAGKSRFKKKMSSNYKIENKRFILMYKLVKASGGVSQFGIDEKGYLILNYPRVIENLKKDDYYSYYAIIEQYIFEKVK